MPIGCNSGDRCERPEQNCTCHPECRVNHNQPCYTPGACAKVGCCTYGERRTDWRTFVYGALLVSVALATAAVALAGCASPPVEDAEPTYKVGDTFEVPGPGVEHDGPFLVHVVTAGQAVLICGSAGLLVASPGCSGWRIGGPLDSTITKGRVTLPAGYSCVVYAPPVPWVIEHELRHCREGQFHPLDKPVGPSRVAP